jgi:hypothetical protein
MGVKSDVFDSPGKLFLQIDVSAEACGYLVSSPHSERALSLCEASARLPSTDSASRQNKDKEAGQQNADDSFRTRTKSILGVRREVPVAQGRERDNNEVQRR